MEPLGDRDPAEVGPYRLVGRLGSGGMGVVYLARAPGGDDVALKLVRPELAHDPDFRVRFRREVDAGLRVGGARVARYLDADVDSPQPYLVTEYVPGGSLADEVAARGPLDGERLAAVAVGLAEAIVALQAAGVIHRDIKPSNVLLAADGPRLVDLGIAHAADATALTQAGVVLGTPSWMAPEQAVGGAVTGAADVFAWGATVAFGASGRPPFGEGRPDAVLYRVVHEPPDLAGLDPALAVPVAAALEKDPAARPGPAALVAHLRLGTRTPAPAAAPGPAPAGPDWRLVSPAVARTVVPPPAAAAPTPRPPVWAATAPPVAPVRHRGFRWVLVAVVLLAAFGGGLLLAHAERATAHRTAGGTAGRAPATTTPGAASPSVAVSLPVVTCSSGSGLGSTTSLPATQTVRVPRALAAKLAVFADDQGVMGLLAPKTWQCSAAFAADGSGGVQVYPPGHDAPSSSPFLASSAQGIVATETSACSGCAEQQACPLFTAASDDYQVDFGSNCPAAKPAAESVDDITGGVVGFSDPPGVAGDASPSGGPYPANGVMTYYSGNQNGSWTETCTMPAADTSLCTTVLDAFVTAYGAD